MQYRAVRTDDIEHGLFSKAGAKIGSTWDKHKYIAKEKVGNGYRYFYSQAELAAAKAKKAGQKIAGATKSGAAIVRRAANNAADSVKTGISTAKKSVSDLRNYHKDVLNRYDKYSKEFNTRSSLHGEYYDTIHDPSTNPAKKHQAQVEIEANWHKMWDAHDKELDTRREIGNKRFNRSLRLDRTLSSVENFVTKGKSIASSLISSTKRISVETVNKGKAFIDYLSNTTPKEIAGSVKSKIDGNIDVMKAKRELEAAKKNYRDKSRYNWNIRQEAYEKLGEAQEKYDAAINANLYRNNSQFRQASDRLDDVNKRLDELIAKKDSRTDAEIKETGDLLDELLSLEKQIKKIRDKK